MKDFGPCFHSLLSAGCLAALPPESAGNSFVPIATVVPPPLSHFFDVVRTASLFILPT